MTTVAPTAFFERVVVESPYAGDIDRNMTYLRACFADCLRRHEAPIASHKLYTDIPECQDDVPERRSFGIEAGFAWGVLADKIVIYTDFGISGGMQRAIEYYAKANVEIEYRQLPTDVMRSWGFLQKENLANTSWRWNGEANEHRCKDVTPQAGHFPAMLLPDGSWKCTRCGEIATGVFFGISGEKR